MGKRAKNLILISSFAAFFILSYFTLFFGFGYQFDFREFKLVKTGSVLIKTNTDASVHINDRFEGNTSFIGNTFTQKNLLPGRYNIVVEKEKFPPLEKNIDVKSGEVVQLVHLYLINSEELDKFMETLEPEAPDENKTNDGFPYFINKKDSLLYKNLGGDEVEKISSGPVIDFILSPDKKKLAIISTNEITVLWLSGESGSPYFPENHKELVLRISQKIDKTYWFKSSWHLIYLTQNGIRHFVELDPSGGRNDLII